MSNIAIEVKNISKKYELGLIGGGTLMESLGNRLKRNKTQSSNAQEKEFWALRDLSFTVERGDVVGIIGKNGAGKSTLLKVISRITQPSSGQITINGRVASLLEVGTGFHPELTGRENIFLNGSILGMTRKEIKTKFDEIVDFSGVEKFIDTPVKRYSSGMYVRLAFAVAAHLEPEILVIDEVLAVGDIEFQKKCLGKMKEVSERKERTVLFVSHNMTSVKNLCSSVILLERGQIAFNGDTGEGVNRYLSVDQVFNNDLSTIQDRGGNGKLIFNRVYITDDPANLSKNKLVNGAEGFIIVELKNLTKEVINHVTLSAIIKDQSDNVLATFNSRFVNQSFNDLKDCEKFIFKIPEFPFAAGKYVLKLRNMIGGDSSRSGGEPGDHLEHAVSFEVENGDFFKSGKTYLHKHGKFLVDFSINKIS